MSGTSFGQNGPSSVSAAITNVNPNGQTTMANSSPVVIASDQSAVPVSGAFPAQYTDGAATPATPTGNILLFDNSGTLEDVGIDFPFPVQLPSSQLPIPTKTIRQYYNEVGKAFRYYSGKQSGVAGTMGFQLFNPAASGKTLRISSIMLILAAAGYIDIRKTTANVNTITGWTDTVITPSNDNLTSANVTAMTCSLSDTNITGVLLGTSISGGNGTANLPVELFPKQDDELIIPSSAGITGIALYLTLAGATVWEVIVLGEEY